MRSGSNFDQLNIIPQSKRLRCKYMLLSIHIYFYLGSISTSGTGGFYLRCPSKGLLHSLAEGIKRNLQCRGLFSFLMFGKEFYVELICSFAWEQLCQLIEFMNIVKYNYINYPKKNVKKCTQLLRVLVNQSQQFQNKASHIYIKSYLNEWQKIQFSNCKIMVRPRRIS